MLEVSNTIIPVSYTHLNKAKEKRNELNEFVKKFMEDSEIPDENFNRCV